MVAVGLLCAYDYQALTMGKLYRRRLLGGHWRPQSKAVTPLPELSLASHVLSKRGMTRGAYCGNVALNSTVLDPLRMRAAMIMVGNLVRCDELFGGGEDN